jgi:hypothetical protein
MNLHILPDDKFIDEFITIADEVASEANVFLVNAAEPLKYVKSKKIRVARYGSREFNSIVGDLSQYKKVYFHSLTREMCRFINSIPADNKVAFLWVFWGFDLYNYIPYQLYDKQTQTYVNKNAVQEKSGLLQLFKAWRRKRYLQQERQQAVQRLSYILHFDEEEYKLVQQYFPTKAKHFFFTYPNVVDFCFLDRKPESQELETLIQNINLNPNKKKVLLGNSGWATGNHLSILQRLASQKSEDLQIIVPLSYGKPEYIDFIISEGRRLLGDNFRPLTSFFSPQVYSYLLQMVDAGLFNSYRTQGAGNIVALLYLGKQVYLNPKTSYYKFLQKRGISIHPINDFFKNKIESLKTESTHANRNVILQMYSNEAIRNTIEKSLNVA